MIHDIFLIYSQVYFQLKTGKKRRILVFSMGWKNSIFMYKKECSEFYYLLAAQMVACLIICDTVKWLL